jgi:RNA 2',3'-cyclic 3'-phosphodiesterase
VPGVAATKSKGERARLFVALDLPTAMRDGIAAWGEPALSDPALRPVPAENLHVTLAFLGHRPVRDAERVAKAMEQSVAPAPLLELLDPVGRPPRGRARLFALPALSPGAERLQAQLSELLISERLYEPEGRPFWPHVTVARVRAEGRGSRRPMRVERTPGSLPAELRKPRFSGRLTLYRSELQPSGARYVPLAQVQLPGRGWQ